MSNQIDVVTGEINPLAESDIGRLAALYAALAKAQQDLGKTGKDGKGHHGKYSTLPACLETITNAFNGKGLSYAFISHPADNAAVIEFKIFHEQGASLSLGVVSIPFAQNTPAARGASQTYAKRYACSLLGLQSADDAEENEKHLHGRAAQTPITVAQVTSAFNECATVEAIGLRLKQLITTYPEQREQLVSAATARKNQLLPAAQDVTLEQGPAPEQGQYPGANDPDAI